MAATKPKAPTESKTPAKTLKAPAKARATKAKTDGLHRPVQPSAELGAIVGDKPLARADIVAALWVYIKKNELQDPKDGRNIKADDTLAKVFGKKEASMFEMSKLVSGHVSAID
jgi:chromatin remodeling complex protein RSC6